jgi:hypothetical protein
MVDVQKKIGDTLNERVSQGWLFLHIVSSDLHGKSD